MAADNLQEKFQKAPQNAGGQTIKSTPKNCFYLKLEEAGDKQKRSLFRRKKRRIENKESVISRDKIGESVPKSKTFS